jgi:hypothetical protein
MVVIGRQEQELGCHFLLFTAALGLYGGVLWSGELQGTILYEMAPTSRRVSDRRLF